ncbi:MAG: chromate transporter [Polaromonas sp.]
MTRPAAEQPTSVSFGQALRFWLQLGFISFGGPAGQIAIMHSDLVERRRWVSEKRFLHALNFCMVLPGPAHHGRGLCGVCGRLGQAGRGP